MPLRFLSHAKGAATSLPRAAAIGRWRVVLLPRAPYRVAYTPDGAVIGFAFEGQSGEHAFAGDRRRAFRARPNGLAYVPAGCDVYSQSDEGGEYLTIEQTVSKGKRALSGRRFSDVVDLAAVEGAERLRAMLLAGEPLDPLLFEHCARALRNGVRRVLCGTAVAPRASGWMTPRRLALVDEMIEARLDGRLTVQELADALGLSAGFFSRAFKAAVGKSPYDYIVDRRVSRARSLLGREGIGLSEVALASGFASHAHMTSVFHARLGVTPSALRRRLD